MPLLIENQHVQSVPLDIQTFIFSFPSLKEASVSLKAEPVGQVGPKGLLYVNQREFAAVVPDTKNIDILGSDDATTCHILVLRHSGSGVTSLAHLDGLETCEGIQLLMKKCKLLSQGGPEGRWEIHLIGGFLDDRHMSQQLTKEIFSVLVNDIGDEVHLLTSCVSDLNDTVVDGIHFPVIYGVGVDIKSGRVFPAQFPHKGPDIDIRSASHFVTSDTLVDVYDARHGLVVGPYQWSAGHASRVSRYADMPDEFIRSRLSTSPEQEPPHFEEHIRSALRVLRTHPKPHITLFPDARPRTYHLNSDGLWLRNDADMK